MTPVVKLHDGEPDIDADVDRKLLEEAIVDAGC